MGGNHNYKDEKNIFFFIPVVAIFVVQLGINVLLWARGVVVRSTRMSMDGIERYLNASVATSHLLPLYIYVLRFSLAIYFIQLVCYVLFNQVHIILVVEICVREVLNFLQYLAWDFAFFVFLQAGIGPKSLSSALKKSICIFIISILVVEVPELLEWADTHNIAGAYLAGIRTLLLGAARFKLCSRFRKKRVSFDVFGTPYMVFEIAECASGLMRYHGKMPLTQVVGVIRIIRAIVMPLALYNAFLVDTTYWIPQDDDEDAGCTLNCCSQGPGRTMSGDIRIPLKGLQLRTSLIGTLNKGLETLDEEFVTTIYHAELSLPASKIIGMGGTARVFHGKWIDEEVAIKLLFMPDITRTTVQTFFQEASILGMLGEHPNIVQLKGVSVAPPSLCHVMELCDGNLMDLIRERQAGYTSNPGTRQVAPVGHFTPWFLSLAIQCARSLDFVHDSRGHLPIVHRDIKSPNFLFKRTVSHSTNLVAPVTIKLTDMDLASYSEGDSAEKGFCGTVQWAAPEVLRRETSGNEACDVFSLTVVLWELLTLSPPFSGLRVGEVLKFVAEGGRLPTPTEIPSGMTAIFQKGWAENPADRPSANEMLANLIGLIEDQHERRAAQLYGLVLLVFGRTNGQRISRKNEKRERGPQSYSVSGSNMVNFLNVCLTFHPVLHKEMTRDEIVQVCQECLENRLITPDLASFCKEIAGNLSRSFKGGKLSRSFKGGKLSRSLPSVGKSSNSFTKSLSKEDAPIISPAQFNLRQHYIVGKAIAW